MHGTHERTDQDRERPTAVVSVCTERKHLDYISCFYLHCEVGMRSFLSFFLSFILSLGDWLGGVLAGDPSSAAALSFWLTCASTSCVFLSFLLRGNKDGRAFVISFLLLLPLLFGPSGLSSKDEYQSAPG